MGSHIAEFLVCVAYNLRPQRDTQDSKITIQLKKLPTIPLSRTTDNVFLELNTGVLEFKTSLTETETFCYLLLC
jgi:hypothetical protein